MAFLGHTFDANQVEPQSDFAPLPAGDYTAIIVNSEMKDAKSGRGQYLELTLQVIDGPMTNRLLWDHLTLVHDNAKTVEIAQRQLSAICHAVGVLQVEDSEQLHNRPLSVRVKYIDDTKYGPKNEIGAYRALAGAAPHVRTAPSAQASAPAQPVRQPPPQPSKPASPPWVR